jgi:hypothetical protein
VINIESEVFNTLATVLRAEYNPISIYGEYVKAPSVFPCVTIEEKDNYVYERSQTSDGIENHAGLMYEINVYSNKKTGKKSQCKDIFSLIDGEMQDMGFTRTMLNPIPDMDDATIYRMVGRYKAVVSTNKTIYRR